jgi:hypothetical protein
MTQTLGRFAVVVACLAAGWTRSPEAQVTGEASREVAARYAVLVGVSDYPDSAPDLRGGPLNDVALMQDLLVHRFGYPAANVLVLRDGNGSRQQVIDAIRQHLGKAQPADLALFYFSGHGVQVEASRGLPDSTDFEPDKLDEALLLWGDHQDRLGYLLDDELGILFDGLSAGKVIAIIDACHSGTATRASLEAEVSWADLGRVTPPFLPTPDTEPGSAATPKRAIWRDVRALVESPDTLLTLGPRPSQREHLLLSASLDNEIALSGPVRLPSGHKRRVGLFTAALYQEMLSAKPTVTIDVLMTRVRRRVELVALRVQDAPQTPTATGPWQNESLRVLFGTRQPRRKALAAP